jgi:death-on-curing protein
LIQQIIKGHALLDGNKRVGITATFVFLRINNYTLKVSKGELLKVALDVATDKMNKDEFISWLEKCSIYSV